MSRPFLIALFTLSLLAGCGREEFSEAEKTTIASLSLAALKPLPPDTTNRYASVPAAAALGATLFFDQRLSRDGNVSCSTCHKISEQFQDGLPRAVGVGTTNRRTMPLAGVAYSPWMFWDGRRGSLWAQALTPLENSLEHAGNRAAYAHFMQQKFGERYERIFGPFPDLSAVPANASPLGTPAEQVAWKAMTDEQRDGVNRVFVNIGKAIAAFERSLAHPETRFDRFAAALAAGKAPEGDAVFSEDEKLGLKLFIGKAECVNCHNGPRFTDEHFHNTGVPVVPGLPEDLGRETGVMQALDDAFNCFGKYRDGGEDACGELRFVVKAGPELERAYKTPSLRGAAGRPPYMHAGQFASLKEVVAHYAKSPPAPSGTSELHTPLLSQREREALVAFVQTLGE